MDKKKCGQFIKEARLSKKMTQAELAEKLYLDVTAVSKWERGVNYPDITLISDLCRCLGITEHELIESSKDSEYRQMLYESKSYRKSRKITFWCLTSCFLIAVLTCFTVNLSVDHRLSWFFIVLTSCACGYWAFFFPVLFPKFRKRAEGEGTVPSLLSRAALLIYGAGLLLLTLTVEITSNAYSPFDLSMGVNITVYCFLILLLWGLVEFFPWRRSVKLGTDSLLTGCFCATLSSVLPALMKVPAEDYFNIDFSDWAGHSNGNVSLLILSSFAAVGIVLIAAGLCGRGKKKRGKE